MGFAPKTSCCRRRLIVLTFRSGSFSGPVGGRLVVARPSIASRARLRRSSQEWRDGDQPNSRAPSRRSSTRHAGAIACEFSLRRAWRASRLARANRRAVGDAIRRRKLMNQLWSDGSVDRRLRVPVLQRRGCRNIGGDPARAGDPQRRDLHILDRRGRLAPHRRSGRALCYGSWRRRRLSQSIRT